VAFPHTRYETVTGSFLLGLVISIFLTTYTQQSHCRELVAKDSFVFMVRTTLLVLI